ncbi:MAG: hypothetical protein LLG37_00580, partial [Spirochaetia bacterium]|nr:hypothetical protein [Spirochaetia bacterium]
MDLSNKLNLQHGLHQELKLTPEMRLRLDVLHATNLELGDILNKEMSENPLIDDVFQEEEIDVVKKDEREKSEEKEETWATDTEGQDFGLTEKPETPEKEEYHNEGNEHNTKTESLDEGDENTGEIGDIEVGEGARFDEIDNGAYENLWGTDNPGPVSRGAGEYNPEVGKIAANNINNLRTDDRSTLSEELIKQLNAAYTDDGTYRAVYELINSMDEKGFIPSDLSTLMESNGITDSDMKKGLALLLSFEPAGIGSSDTRECLLLQLKHRGLQETLTFRMVDKYFSLLARQDYTKIASSLKVREAD